MVDAIGATMTKIADRYVEALRSNGFEDAAKYIEQNPPELSRSELEDMSAEEIAELDQDEVDQALEEEPT